ncbi:MAG: GIY-YIG nuclease family protein [Clostridia bacterium]|nr:GIY-YIG nuclease family protein [Clostridia bacterium]
MYYTYLLRCTDGSLYTGIASNLFRRMKEHFTKDPKCAKYTRTHPPKELCAAWESHDRAAASRLEYQLKQKTKLQKEILACGGDLSEIFEEEFCKEYRRLSAEELHRE